MIKPKLLLNFNIQHPTSKISSIIVQDCIVNFCELYESSFTARRNRSTYKFYLLTNKFQKILNKCTFWMLLESLSFIDLYFVFGITLCRYYQFMILLTRLPVLIFSKNQHENFTILFRWINYDLVG